MLLMLLSIIDILVIFNWMPAVVKHFKFISAHGQRVMEARSDSTLAAMASVEGPDVVLTVRYCYWI